ncbi:uncharacterized protein LOC135461355 [Liolophura sinensis]|uniref:uncharacterized protein LOC135461355 n=1 Tax=Liolophura sinensis TaxID=3198878 RepID=UPI0031593B42
MLLVLATTLLSSLYGSVVSDFPFRNVSLPWDARVADLVNRLTLQEMMLQMSRGGVADHGGPAPAIDRLQIKPYSWNTECLRGDVGAGPATAFPQALGLAASFSPSLIQRVAEATSIEVRAKFNDYMQKEQYGDHKGASCFSPVINIMRHPLWGRSQETYGEDPFLSGTLAQHFVYGLQGNDSRYIRANAGCKHFDVHGGPENVPVSRFSFDSKVSERDWRLTFLAQFRMCVEAGTYNLMCSYNSINGVPACANHKLLTEILREEWGFRGYVISDQGAVENIISQHHYVSNNVDAATAIVNAGMNLELSNNLVDPVMFGLEQAVSQGKVTMDTVKERVSALFYTRMRLGEFDPKLMNPYADLSLESIQSPQHRALSLEATLKSFVLLKNADNFLPMKKGQYANIGVVGPMANNVGQQFGDYSPDENPQYTTTPLDGLKQLGGAVTFAAGCETTKCTSYNSSDVKNTVTGKDIVFVVLGTGRSVESEGNDRATMDLPGQQAQLLQDAISMSNRTPIVLILLNAGPLEISMADSSSNIKAILEAFFPAQAAGEAIARVLMNNGDFSNPGGRLPYTWYQSLDQVPSITNYTMAGRTYRYFTGKPLYPFGYGLSYTNFVYNSLILGNRTISAGQSQTVRVVVKNVGTVTGDEVIQVYIRWVNPSSTMPNIQLAGVYRTTLLPNQDTAYTFEIRPHQMAIWDDDRGFVVEPGNMMVYAGGQQPGQSRSVDSNVLTSSFTIVNQKVLRGVKLE